MNRTQGLTLCALLETLSRPVCQPKLWNKIRRKFGFQLRYCGAGELVVQMTCDCQSVVRYNERKSNHLSAFHFFIPYNFDFQDSFEQTKYTPVKMCSLGTQFLLCFVTSYEYATCIPDTSKRCCLADNGRPIHHHPLGFKQHPF